MFCSFPRHRNLKDDGSDLLVPGHVGRATPLPTVRRIGITASVIQKAVENVPPTLTFLPAWMWSPGLASWLGLGTGCGWYCEHLLQRLTLLLIRQHIISAYLDIPGSEHDSTGRQSAEAWTADWRRMGRMGRMRKIVAWMDDGGGRVDEECREEREEREGSAVQPLPTWDRTLATRCRTTLKTIY